MRWGTLWISAMLAAGCSSERCELVSGAYVSRYVEISGTCGPLPDDQDVLSASLGPPFGGANDDVCVGPFAFTEDMCAVDYDRRCDVYAEDGTLLGQVHFEGTNEIVSPTRVEGAAEITVLIDAPCSSVYEITWTPI